MCQCIDPRENSHDLNDQFKTPMHQASDCFQSPGFGSESRLICFILDQLHKRTKSTHLVIAVD